MQSWTLPTVIAEPKRPRSYVVVDIESAVTDETGHRRYQAMERYVPRNGDGPGRRGYKRSEDPLRCPRWPFQTIVTAVAMTLVEHPDGNLEMRDFHTFSCPDRDERGIVAGLLGVFAEAPEGAELVTWGGMMHDVPMILLAAMRHGLTLPRGWGWGWMAMGGGRQPHIDLARCLTGGFRMKPVHEAEILATLDIPAKIAAPAFAVARLIGAGAWDIVRGQCEGDVIASALLLARWRRLHDPRVGADVAEDRILRQVIETRPERRYVAALRAHRNRQFAGKVIRAANDAATLAPWLDSDAA